jgi:glutamate decarboxylase
MVHLAAIPTDQDIKAPTIAGHSLDKLKNDVFNDVDDSFTTTVYGSKYAALDLPKHEMPENEMPREVAYRMIKYVTDPSAYTKLNVLFTETI